MIWTDGESILLQNSLTEFEGTRLTIYYKQNSLYIYSNFKEPYEKMVITVIHYTFQQTRKKNLMANWLQKSADSALNYR